MEYNQERFGLNRLCEFSIPEVEAEFMEYEKKASLNLARLLLLLMGFVFTMFALQDYYFYGSGEIFIFSLGLRGAALFLCAAAFSLAGTFRRHERALMMITATELGVFALYLVILYRQKHHEPSVQFMSMMLFILSVFLIPNRWKNCLVSGGVMVLGYVIFSPHITNPREMPTLVQRGVYLGVCLLACAAFLFGRENSRRKQFAVEKQLEFMSITDRLTGVYNRAHFEHILGQWIKGMRHNPFCLLLFDIDNFKQVNDRLGHDAGDKALIGTAGVISSHIRTEDVFARWGGEEFVLLFGKTGVGQAAELAERLRREVENHQCGPAGKITISIGVSQFRPGETAADLVKRADENMYAAKRAGKNRVAAGQDAGAVCPA